MTAEWKTRDPMYPHDDVFKGVGLVGDFSANVYTTDECLRILAASGFTNPVFQFSGSMYCRYRRCVVTGPDGEQHDAWEVLNTIFKAERLERLCQDRSDPVLGMLRRRKR